MRPRRSPRGRRSLRCARRPSGRLLVVSAGTPQVEVRPGRKAAGRPACATAPCPPGQEGLFDLCAMRDELVREDPGASSATERLLALLLERHATFRALAGPVALHVGVHRATVAVSHGVTSSLSWWRQAIAYGPMMPDPANASAMSGAGTTPKATVPTTPIATATPLEGARRSAGWADGGTKYIAAITRR